MDEVQKMWYKDAIKQLEAEISWKNHIAQIPVKENALQVQKGGTHYKRFKIQPIEYIHANNIPFTEGNIIKYITRWRFKDGIKDLEKAKHCIDLLIELENANNPRP